MNHHVWIKEDQEFLSVFILNREVPNSYPKTLEGDIYNFRARKNKRRRLESRDFLDRRERLNEYTGIDLWADEIYQDYKPMSEWKSRRWVLALKPY